MTRSTNAAVAEKADPDVAGKPTLEQLANPIIVRGLDGQVVFLERLPLRKILALLRIGVTAYAGANSEARMSFAQQIQSVNPAEAPADSFSIALGMLDEDQAATVLNIVTNKSKEWCLDQLGALELAQLAEALAENEQLDQVLGAFRRVGGRWRSPSNT